jgi:recombination protein RecR
VYPKSIQKLIGLFSHFPGIGPKTASRLVFHLLKEKDREVGELARAIANLKESLKTCRFCFKSFDSNKQGQLCEICSNPLRRKNLLCVVASETDLAVFEQAKIYKGVYFVLGGTFSPLDKQPARQLRLEELRQRIRRPEKFGLKTKAIEEIILALNPTVEGQATALYLERKLADLNKKITRLGLGLPQGAELEYADRKTLSSALKSRKQVS